MHISPEKTSLPDPLIVEKKKTQAKTTKPIIPVTRKTRREILRGLERQKAKDKLRVVVLNFNPSLVFIAAAKIHSNSPNRIRLPGMNHKIIHNTCDSRKANLWMFWNNSVSTPVAEHFSRQSIIVEVGDVLITGIHADVLSINRRELWAELAPFRDLNKPWMILGDFNTITTLDAKKGGGRPITSSVAEFNEWIDYYQLFSSSKNRALFNSLWLDKYPSWKYQVTSRGISDHNILLGTNSDIQKPLNCPFKFQKMWISHPSFLQLVTDAWKEVFVGNPIFIFMNKLKFLKNILKKWNWEVFGNIQVKLKEAEKKVFETNALSDADRQNLLLLNNYITTRGERDLVAQNYHTILSQKARVNWIKYGDANTCFFHTSIKLRQATNSITELENDAGAIVTDQKEIASMLINYFSSKFSEHTVEISDTILNVIPQVISDDENSLLASIPSMEEIKNAVLS
ncbi:uncharacterized protein LOC113271914 [Papaver somniferum]|uniref:uncharacterized protein LOC113271914 n=1 Tax=Papaver somniferum TaxID=3469 RepID=UPI000E70312C|nr:uncharacterized protein LOC113271914 [Papaver somniferum]